MIRIDWEQAKYRLLDFEAFKSYLLKIGKCIIKEQNISKHYNEDVRILHGYYSQHAFGSSLLEANEKLILIRSQDGIFDYWSRPTNENIKSYFNNFGSNFMATILDNNVYILTKSCGFITFNIDQFGEPKSIGLQRFQEDLNFDNLLLTSSQANDDRVILLDKSTKDVFCFNVNTQKWSPIGLLINYKYNNSDGQKEPVELLTFTSTLLSIDTIRPCLKRKLI